MSVEVAKDLVARLAVDEEFRATIEQAGDGDKQRRLVEEAGYGGVSPDDVLQVQTAVQQKGMIGDLAGFFAPNLGKTGYSPGGQTDITRNIVQVTDLLFGMFL